MKSTGIFKKFFAFARPAPLHGDDDPALRAAHRRIEWLEAALNALPRPIWIRDSKQTIIWCNKAYGIYASMPPEEALRAQKEIASQALKRKTGQVSDLDPGKKLAEAAFKSGEIVETDAHTVVSGNRILVRIMEIPIPLQQATIGTAYNNTREEDLETALRRYQSSNEDLLGQMHSAIAIYTADQKLEFYNAAFAQLWGLEESWLNTQPRLGDIMERLRETRHLPEQTDFKRFKKSWIDMFTTLIGPFEDMLHLPDNTTLRMAAVPHSMGGLMMTFEDVTSRLELESSYNTLIAVQKETLDNLGEAVAAFGGDGRLKLWNPSYARLWKLNPEDLEGEPHVSLVVEKMKPCFAETEWPLRRNDLIEQGLERVMHEGRMARLDGTILDYTTVPLPDGGVLVTYTDTTDKVRIENVLREKNAALETAEQLKLDFLANVSYELRTPLNAIMGFTEILENQYFGPLNERQREYTRDMKDASTHLLGLINDILDLSTLEAGYMSLERQDVNIGAMLDCIRDLVGPWARKEQVAIKIDYPPTIGAIMADERRLQQAIINLVRNAIGYIQPGGHITITASRKKTGIEISVSDTASAASQAERLRVFEPFERAQRGGGAARLTRGGSGIGLSLVRNIVTLHGGRVEMADAKDEDNKVTIFLPFTSIKTDLILPVGGITN